MSRKIEDGILDMLDSVAGWCRVIFWLFVGLLIYAVLSCTLNAAQKKPVFDEKLATLPPSPFIMPPLPPGFEAAAPDKPHSVDSLTATATAVPAASTNPPAIEITCYSPGTLTNGQRIYAVDITVNGGGTLQTSTNLTDWVDTDLVCGGVYSPNIVIYVDPAAESQRFFRMKQ